MIQVEELRKSYGAVTAVDGVSFRVESGVLGLVGVNGAGKTTLLEVLATAIAPDSGTVSIAGNDLSSAAGIRAIRSKVALMPQMLNPPSGMSLGDFMSYMAWVRGVPRRHRADRITETLRAVGLEGRQNQKMTALSGGMLRRAAYAQAVVNEPEVLLLDEPTTGLDPEQRIGLRSLIEAEGKVRIVIVSSHVMEDIATLSPNVVMLDAGRVVYDGTVAKMAALGEELTGPGAELSPLEAAFMHLRTTGLRA